MFSSLMPQRKEFYELLAAHSDRVVAAANATLRLINSLGLGVEDTAALAAEVSMNEKSADKIKAELITLLHKSFTTPINRDQIHTLTIELDNVVNALKDVANAVGMYSIKESTPEAREMAALGADACMRLNRAVMALPHKNRNDITTSPPPPKIQLGGRGVGTLTTPQSGAGLVRHSVGTKQHPQHGRARARVCWRGSASRRWQFGDRGTVVVDYVTGSRYR